MTREDLPRLEEIIEQVECDYSAKTRRLNVRITESQHELLTLLAGRDGTGRWILQTHRAGGVTYSRCPLRRRRRRRMTH